MPSMPRKPFALALLLSLLSLPSLFALDPDLLAGLRARSIGPAGMSGRVTSIAAFEGDSRIVYVGAASGGIWKSVDGAVSWTPVFEDQGAASIGALAVFQGNPDVVWAGTGEGNVRNSVSAGNGVYRSIDGGKTWSHLGLEKSERIYRVVLHPTDPEVAWVSALGALWSDGAERGVYKTTDGGKSWRKVLYIDEKTGASDLVIDPQNPRKLFASMWQFRRWPWTFKSGGPGSGLFVSYDAGESWKEITDQDGLPKGELGRIGLAVSRSQPDVVYAMVEAKKSALLRSQDGGRSWATVNDRYDVNPRPFYFCDIRVDPELPNRVYSLDFNLRVSEDGGKSFAPSGAGRAIHGDYHALWIDPSHPDLFYFGDDGGIAVSRDRGRTAAFISNLPLAQYYHVAVDMERPYNIYGGLQDNGSWRGPNTSWSGGGVRNDQWRVVGGGDGFDTRPDAADPNLVYAMSQAGELQRVDLRTGEIRALKPSAPKGTTLRFNWNSGLATDPFDPATLYYGSQFLHKTTDRGESWTTISPDLTTNNPAWQKQSESGGLTPDDSGAENFTTIIAIAPSAVERGVIWTGSDDGRLHVTRDGGATWTSVERNVPGVPVNTWIPHVVASKYSGGQAFVLFDNHRRGDFTPYVYRTDDYGKSWKSLATKDLHGWALSLEQDPVKKDLLFLGTELGLFVSFDGGGHWLAWKHGVPTTPVADLVIHPREHDLVIATHGRALYVIDDIRPLREISDATLAEPLHLYGIAETQEHWVDAEPGGFGSGNGFFRGENRAYGALLTVSVNAPDLPLPDEKKERERKLAERQALRVPVAAEAKGKSQEDAKVAKAETKTPEATPGAAPAEAEKKDDKSEKAEDKPEPPKEVEIQIADASGKVIRTFTAPVKEGVNRIAWDLHTDGPKAFPSEQPPEPHGEGFFEVRPGSYKATVKFRDQEASAPLTVTADPRTHYSEADWTKRDEAIGKATSLLNVLAEAAQRIRKAQADIDLALARREKPPGKAEDKPGAKDEKKDPLAEAAGKLQESLKKVEKKVWLPFDSVGLTSGSAAAATWVFNTSFYLASSYAPPSPNLLQHLEGAEQRAREAIDEVNRIFATEVEPFRKQVEEAGIRILAAGAPLAVTP